MLISVLTGIVAGALHVVGGADHLVAMTPSALENPKTAFRNGLAWGMGHSLGVVCLALIAILAKDLVQIQRMSTLAEFSVGIALLIIGALAIRTSLGLVIHSHKHKHKHKNANEYGHNHDHIHLHFRGRKRHKRHTHAATGLGLLHGLAGTSHLLAVIPALALPPIGAGFYIAAYLFGSIATMGAFVGVISFATLKVGSRLLPLIFGCAGGLSVAMGVVWLHKTTSYII
ncbi:hydantoin utilization protein A [Prochlorococcus sp. MIT 1341]|uniref:hydantoin utilization protein A n=1 Tax=Prochlorococcus sp. MIT 1341 TaxID=3096221 RepID=UPI002A7566CE|nr:hydantoin utilization protein A [Prochlorococcus sp. MIT 1341]